MDNLFAVLPPLITVVLAIWSKRVIPALLVGLLAAGYFKTPHLIGGIETTLDYVVRSLTEKGNIQVLLFLYLFSGLIYLVKRSGGTKAFAARMEKKIYSKIGVFHTLWALIPFTFIDCGFRVMGSGSITRPLAREEGVNAEKLAFQLNNTASPVVELVPVATTFVGFNVGIIQQGLQGAGTTGSEGSAYSVLLQSIPMQFFSIIVLILTFAAIYRRDAENQFGSGRKTANPHQADKEHGEMDMAAEQEPVIPPALYNLALPLLSVVLLSLFFFWYFGKDNNSGPGLMAAIQATEPNKAMLVALLIALLGNGILFLAQGYPLKQLSNDVIRGGNEIMNVLAILVLAWPLALATRELGLGVLIQEHFSAGFSAWLLPVTLFVLSCAVTYLMGSSWGGASLIMPLAIPLAAAIGAGIPLCVAAVLSGATFGDVTSPISGMTHMASKMAGADHAAYIRYASRYNFTAAGISGLAFLLAGWFI